MKRRNGWAFVSLLLLCAVGFSGRAVAQSMDVTIRVPDKSGRPTVNDERPTTGYLSRDFKTYFAGKNDQSVDDMVSRNFAGVSCLRGEVTIRMQPCRYYQVDGAPVPDLSVVDPNDIYSITVLKDISETLIYGKRAENGAVIVKTRSSRY